MAKIGDINNYETSAKLKVYASAPPTIYQSGTHTAPNTAMEKRSAAY